MTADDRQALDQLLDEVLHLTAGERETAVQARFGHRPELLREAVSLLEHAEAASARFPDPETIPLPKRAGPYRLLEELGRGGMGVVFVAERDDGRFEQRVAVKLLPPAWGMAGSLRRFEAECRILARLEHPRICRILDSGRTQEGWPFLTMELVSGETLGRWCSAGRTEEQKLRAFLQICDAVQYAHSNLVIHRDLKPQNIVINAAGDAKLLDFGTARLLSGESEQATVPMLTPKYASPEQLQGAVTTTVSDVFSLGIILRELVGAEPAADLRAIAEKAAAAEPSARYGSAAQLSEDIDRYLRRAPVLARPQTFRYVASRLLDRYRREMAIVAAMVIIVLAGVAGVLWQARVAARERNRAMQHFANVRKLASSLVFDLHDRIEKVPGALDAREALLRRAAEYLDILARDGGSDAGVQVEVAQAYRRLSELEFDPAKPNRMNMEGAVTALNKAEVSARAAVRLEPRGSEGRIELVRLLVKRTSLHASNARLFPGQEKKTPDPGEEALALARQLAREFPEDVRVTSRLCEAQFGLAAAYESADLPRAIAAYGEALQSCRQAFAQRPDIDHRANLAITSRALGVALTNAGKLKEAKGPLEEALAADELMLASQPNNPKRSLMVSYDLSSLFSAAAIGQEWEESLRLGIKLMKLRETIVQRDPADQGARLRLWYAYTNVTALALVRLNRPVEALEQLNKGRELEPGLAKKAIPAAWLGWARHNEARAREKSGERRTACALFREAGDRLLSVPPKMMGDLTVEEVRDNINRTCS